ncbi:uncharacterized protein E6C27_scaffold90G00100 [Cucumis melo var. makuwa]|uniref:CACTA en-spm transposon protein n=1 Tax=Cucumis melo var. makuwa TaxID=1194695 RepID=A0A5A7VBA0_CUCMM|nr:uncharacterized protein E6C27_scaffold90G00100 [Cucumis melo var. makuwa]
MKQNENFVTWAWNMRLFTRASMTVYCIGKNLLICSIVLHVARLEGWKHFDSEFSDFASDPRNGRLGLASDGFNPFGQMSTSYSMWPVVLLSYNLPPWKCMKETNFFTSLLIPSPKSPGREIDVYLQPLIEELKELWTFGVRTYDSLTSQFFQLYAALLWTINDFPAYGDLSGWSTKGYQACSIWMGDRSSFGIRGRISFMGHRRYLPQNHVWRRSRLHDGKVERKAPPVMLTTFKEFRADCHRHFKKYNDPKEARANPPNALVGRHEDWHFLCDNYIRRAFQAAEDAHNQMLELQSQPTPEVTQPLSEDEICDQVLGRRPDYSKGLGCGPKPKVHSASSSSTSCS